MIGIYGGTFNPVHYGHLRTALEVKEQFELEEMRLIPCRLPTHRQEPDVAAEMRLEMLKLAIAETPSLQIDRRELDREGPSYMVDTLKSIREEQDAHKALLLFIGVDVFAGLERWRQWRQLFQYAHIVVMTRPAFKRRQLPDFFQQRLVEDPAPLQLRPFGCLFFQTVTQLDISATQIRELIASGRNPQFLLPDAVLAFIRQHQLYQSRTLTTGQ